VIFVTDLIIMLVARYISSIAELLHHHRHHHHDTKAQVRRPNVLHIRT